MAAHPYRSKSYIQPPRNLQTHNPSFDRSLSALEWSSTPTSFYAHEDLYDASSQKKSIFARAKETANKWRQSLLRTKSTKREESNRTPPWGVSLNDDDEEDDPELIHGTSKTEVYAFEDSHSENNSTIHHPSPCSAAVSSPPDPAIKNAERDTEMKESDDGRKQRPADVLDPESIKLAPVAVSATEVSPAPDVTTADASPSVSAAASSSPGSSKSLSETLAGTLAPAYAAVAGATMAISSKMRVSARKQIVREKGASMKVYLMQKLAEPKAENKALSGVIEEAASPRADGAHGTFEEEEEKEGAASYSSPVASSASSISSALGSAKAKEEEAESSTQRERAESPIPVSSNPHQGGYNEPSGRTSRVYTN